jgi:predicted nuclease of predicted toxin-antitoxin system
VRFLVDQNLSPLVAKLLRDAGHDAIHTREIGMERSDDADIFDRAAAEDRTIVSADTDFSTLLAQRGASRPSLVLWRRSQDRRAASVAAVLLANLESVEAALSEGAIVVLREDRLRVRPLPLR